MNGLKSIIKQSKKYIVKHTIQIMNIMKL
jgi:hypothetical protein